MHCSVRSQAIERWRQHDQIPKAAELRILCLVPKYPVKATTQKIMDLVDELFVFIFTELNEKCKKELEAVGKQYPFEPLKFLEKTLRLTFEEGIQMLKEAGVEVDPLGDLNTESERKLGQLVQDCVLYTASVSDSG
ncbi:hypothetical protein YC2023_110485 [Brassica napus]